LRHIFADAYPLYIKGATPPAYFGSEGDCMPTSALFDTICPADINIILFSYFVKYIK
jgi:hypothetical protein